MEPEEFAARRRARFKVADEDLEPLVRKALRDYAQGVSTWDDELIEAASVLWLEVFASEAPSADSERFMPRFQESVKKSLAQTDQPGPGPLDEAQVQRVTKWLGTYTMNDATFQAAGARGVRSKRWTTMHDSAVREAHAAVDGQVRPIAAPFNVGGYELRFPGDPVGPPEIWINCRCIVQPAERRGVANVSPTTFAIDEEVTTDTEPIDVPDEDLPVDELEDDEEEITEIPVHGVLAPEGIPTGDGRQFGAGSLSHRDLPLPIAYQVMSAEGHSNAVTVGRIDDVQRVAGEMRFTGALMVGREKTAEVVEGIIDGTVRGISVDVDNVVVGNMSDEGEFGEGLVEFAEARIAGVTIVPIPAFQEAFIGLGHEFLADLPDEAKEALAACGCEGDPDDENEDIVTGYDVYRVVKSSERKRLADKGEALPDGSFPIANEEDLRNAIQAIGRAKDPAAAKAHIKKRARALGRADLIPEEWGADVIDLTNLTEEELAAYDGLSPEEQAEFDTEYLIASAFAPGTKDGPGWITHPIPTSRIRRYWTHGKGAAKIRWGAPGDFNRCRRQLAKYVTNPQWLAGTCANMHKEALGIWPSTHAGRVGKGHALAASGESAPMFTLVAAASRVFPSEYFQEPMEAGIGVIVDGDRVYGYVAEWGVCHIGIDGLCTTAPQSSVGYPYYATGTVHLDDGSSVRVGQITMDTGHASLKANYRVAAAHYDNTGAAVADITVGENAYGIWFSGVLRRTATEDQRHALEASGRLSGDWRKINGQWEMVAALAVNCPGFPIPDVALAASGGEQYALVAAGVVPVEQESTLLASATDPDMIAGIARAAVQEYVHQMRRTERAESLRTTVREKRLGLLRAQIKEN